MTTKVVCALITVGGTLLSSLIAFLVSRTTANKEIEKMKLTWNREDTVSSDEEFAAMASAVALYVSCRISHYQSDAMERLAALRASETGELSQSLDNLYFAVRDARHGDIDSLLTKLLNQKRETKTNSLDSNRNKPTKH